MANHPTPKSSNGSSKSQFHAYFSKVKCRGKGAFGVVFEAQHKLDDCVYAIKIIPLPNCEESQEKWMREVKALARLNQLDHPHIVRYYNSWIEDHYPGWLEAQDQLCLSNSSNSEDHMTQEREENNIEIINHLNQNVKSKQSTGPYEDYIFRLSSGEAFSREASSDAVLNHKMKEIIWDSAMDSGNSMDLEPPVLPRRYLFIQMQLCKEKNLKDWLRDQISIKHKDHMRLKVINMFEQIVLAVEYIHKQGLIHRDLKPTNIFFSHDRDQIKVGDFGLVTAMVKSGGSDEAERSAWSKRSHTGCVGTELYMSPELASALPYNFKVDIYSLGMILFELLVPFATDMERIHVLTNLRKNHYPEHFQCRFPKEFELLQLMLSHHPDERPTASDILPKLHILDHSRPTAPPVSTRKSISQSLE